MPGYLTSSNNSNATDIPFVPTGGIAASNVQSAVAEVDNEKATLASPTFTGNVVLPATTTIGNVSSTEIGYVDGVTSAIQTQLNAKAPIASPTFTGDFTVDTNTLYVDSTNDRVGIGTSSPSTQVHVSTTNEAMIRLQSTGTNGRSYDILSTGGTTGIGQGNFIVYDRNTNGTVLKIDSSGRTTIPYQPGIVLDGNNGSWITYGGGGVDNVISAFTTEFSRGGITHNGSGRITLPVSGYYLFYYQLYVQGTSPGRANLRVNGVDRVVGQFSTGSADTTGTGMTIVPIAANDYAELVGTNFDPLTCYMGAKHSFWGCYLIG